MTASDGHAERDTVEVVALDGTTYTVPADLADYFYHSNGVDGPRPLTDEEWNITRDRLRAIDAWPFDHLDD